MNADHTQEGVMDSLFEALQTGSAFSRDQRRRRQAGASGGNNVLYNFYIEQLNIMYFNTHLSLFINFR